MCATPTRDSRVTPKSNASDKDAMPRLGETAHSRHDFGAQGPPQAHHPPYGCDAQPNRQRASD